MAIMLFELSCRFGPNWNNSTLPFHPPNQFFFKNLENNTQKHRQNIKENAIGKIAFQAKTPLYATPERHQSQYLTQRKATYNP